MGYLLPAMVYWIRKGCLDNRKAGKINKNFGKTVDEMIAQSKQESTEEIRTPNEMRKEIGLPPIKKPGALGQ